MVIDALLVFLWIYHPTLGTFATAAVVIAIRHVPVLADEIAYRIDAESYHGLTAYLARLALPGWTTPEMLMAREEEEESEEEGVVSPPSTISTASTQPIVTPNNEYSSGLSDSGRVQFEERARAIAELYEDGLVTNLSKAICSVYTCSVQSASKTDSTYQMALKAVNRHLTKNKPQFRQDEGGTAPASYPVTKQ